MASVETTIRSLKVKLLGGVQLSAKDDFRKPGKLVVLDAFGGHTLWEYDFPDWYLRGTWKWLLIIEYYNPSGCEFLSTIIPKEQLKLQLLLGFRVQYRYGVAANDTFEHNCLPDSFANPAIAGDDSIYVVGESGQLYLRDCAGNL